MRAEFTASYSADGPTEKARADAKKHAFSRAMKQALAKGLIAARELGGFDHLWFADPQDERDIPRDTRDTV